MSIWTGGSKRKPSGGKYHRSIPKKKSLLGRIPSLTRVTSEKYVKNVRTKGGGRKVRGLGAREVNVYDPKKKKIIKAVIEDVLENQASRHYVRMDVITRGAVLKTSLGPVRVTNRPGQEGVVNAVMTDYQEKVKESKSKAGKEKKAKKHKDKKAPKVKVKREGLSDKVKKAITGDKK